MPRFRILLARLRGLPKGLRRRIERAPKRTIAAFRDFVVVKVARRLGVHLHESHYDPNRVREYAPIGKCVYCGKSEPEVNLTREHILAYSLGGDAVLRKASCTGCQKIIQPLEEFCATEIFRDIRVHHGVHSRSGHADALPLYTSPSEARITSGVLVPIADHPGWLVMPSFNTPGIVRGASRTEQDYRPFTIHGWQLNTLDDAQRKNLATKGINLPWNFRQMNVVTFARVIAKTAHCTAVAHFGVAKFEPALREPILSGTDLPYFVGCTTDVTPPPEEKLNWARYDVRRIGNKKYVVVSLRLFPYVRTEMSEKGTPVYSVVVGEFRPWWVRLAHSLGSPPHNTDKTPARGQ